MNAITEGFAVVGGPRFRAWHGVLADVWEVDASPGAAGEYLSQYPRLFVVLDEARTGSIRIDDAPRPSLAPPARLSFIPAGFRTWSHVAHTTRLRHLDLHFDIAAMAARFGGEIDAERLVLPRLMFNDDRILALAHLLATECTTPALHDLYGESLTLAIFIELFQLRADPRRQGQLSQRRLRNACEFIESNCLRTIKVEEVAELVGLSPSYFSTAFKASTGLAPHQWQMKARVERVQRRLLVSGNSLVEVAHATGFADQAHMTRVFKQFAGVTPAVWLRAHRAVTTP